MEKKPLLEFNVDELLIQFGMGKPTPGSGSAAALQVLVATQLLRTVIQLTGKPKFKPSYDEWLPDLQQINAEIKTRIYSELKELFQEDSDQFDKYIQLFKEHERELNLQIKVKRYNAMLKQLKVVTECAIALTKLCVEIGDFAVYVFDHGFRDARGDSAVALNSAVASTGGCLVIIELNLLSFKWDDWTEEIRLQLRELKAAHNGLIVKAAQCLKSLEEENVRKHESSYAEVLTDIRSGRWEEVVRSERSIEELARHMQNVLWRYRDLIWKDETVGNYRDVLKPEVAIKKLLGYHFDYVNLGKHFTDQGEEVMTAGQIHKDEKTILLSPTLPRPIQNFTAAHELGHALLHTESGLHRDISLDGSPYNTRDMREVQANKFAAFFLMPTKLVKARFQELFVMEKFVIDDNTVFFLNAGRVNEFRTKVRDREGLAFYLSSAEFFQRPFASMADTFNVSVSAMAYRILELDLVEY